MARLPRKPALLKYPKKPTAKSSTAVLERYLERVRSIDKANQERQHAYERAVREYEQEKKRHAELARRISGIGKASEGLRRRHTVKKRKPAAKHATKRKKSSRKKATRRRR